jgi:hypothetical protein
MITAQISCDVCGRVKGEANHWWIVITYPDRANHIAFGPANTKAAEGSKVEHICGEACAHIRLARALSPDQPNTEKREPA